MAEAAPSLSQLRLLILSPRPSASSDPSVFPSVLYSLTGEAPSTDLTTFAGYTSHPPLVLRTKYYSKQVSLWCDELPPTLDESPSEGKAKISSTAEGVAPHESSDDLSDETLNLQQWQETMLSSAASEVREVMGGIVLILPVTTSKESSETQLDSFMPYLRAAHALREAIEEESLGRDIASVVILQEISSSASSARDSKAKEALKALGEALETKTIDNDMFGWDVACCSSQSRESNSRDAESDARNEFGEKLGMARVVEVLEGIDWAASVGVEGDDDENESGVLGEEQYTGLDHELQQEMLGLKLSMLDGDVKPGEAIDGEDISSEQMEDLKSRVLAIRDTVAGMPEAQKQAFARREIDRIMRDL